MLRKKKLYVRPKKAFESARIKDENELVKRYGLKNKREIWKTLAKITYYRRRAKELARAPIEEQEVFFSKLNALGLKANSIADVLGLKVENLLERRLPSVMARKKIASSPKQARQMVVHKKVAVDGNVINIPSYIVPVAFENSILIRQKQKQEQKESSEVREEKNA